MNAGVELVKTYLNVNGYFTLTELPVIRKGRREGYEQVTDVDVLALRFPRAKHLVSEGRPGPADDLTFADDPELDVPTDAMDMILGEVKEGSPEINPALRSRETLYTALVRIGCCPEVELDRVVDDLRRQGEARLMSKEGGDFPGSCRIRLVAFGRGEPGRRSNFTVVSLARVADFLDQHLERYHQVLHPADLGDPVLGLLHLLKKVRQE